MEYWENLGDSLHLSASVKQEESQLEAYIILDKLKTWRMRNLPLQSLLKGSQK